MMNLIFDKTDKGREEIATRKYHLASRQRTLLVMIDGKQDAKDLLKKVTAIGIDEQSMTELVNQGFIAPLSTNAAGAVLPDAAIDQPGPVSEPPPPAVLPAGENQFQAIYHFYNETIKSTIGLRGYGLQLKVERAASIDDFRALRQAYLEAVLKAKGNEMAISLRDRLDQLLNFDGTPADAAARSQAAS